MLLVVLSIFVLFSCKKELQPPIPETRENATFPITDKEKQQVSLLNEVANILKEVYKNPKAYYEVNAAIYSGYYEDESVLLRDLLLPEYSTMYKSENFKKYKAETGIFKREFLTVYDKGDYPYLKKALRLDALSRIMSNTNSSRIEGLSAAIPTDTSMSIFSNSNGVAIYFPYSENFGSNFSPSYFDNINKDPWGNFATVIPSDREADSAPGQEPYRYKTSDANGNIVWEIRYRAVTVNDTYAEAKATHIVGVGAEPALSQITNPPDPPPGSQINRVYHGWCRIGNQHQFDKLISFSGNGGGSEMKVCRISGYLQMTNQQVTNFAGDISSVKFKRKEIRRGIWKRIYSVWDPDWKTNNLEQVYAVYEEDTEGTKTFTGSLSTTLTVSTGNTAIGTIGYNIQVKTQDELITQRKQDRNSYFIDAKNDQGWGFQMCDPDKCGYDNTFLPFNVYWPKYDEGADFGFTWSYKTF